MKINNETKVGLMVLIVIVMLVSITIKTGKFNLSQDGYTIKVLFRNIDGVNLNSPVMFNGYEIGIVEDIQIKYGADAVLMELILWIKDDVKLKEGTKAIVKNLGFMGEKYVGLFSGDQSSNYLTQGATIIGQEPTDFEKLMSDGQKIADQIKQITININERLDTNKATLDSILASTNESMQSIASITKNIDERLKVNAQNIDDIVANMSKVSTNLDEMSIDLKHNPWKIFYRKKAKTDSKNK